MISARRFPIALAFVLSASLVSTTASAQDAETTTTAAASSQPTTEGLNFSVALPADPVQARVGEKIEKQAQLTNNSTVGADFSVSIISVNVGDEGKVTPAEDRDDQITKDVTAPSTVHAESGQTVNIPVTIAVSDFLDPDIYFAGLLVQPANISPSAQGVTTINRLLNVVAVDVVGAQMRGVEISYTNIPKFHVRGSIHEQYAVFNRNAGVSISRVVSIKGDGVNRVVVQNTSGTGADGLARTSLDTIARGHKKTFSYTWSPGRWTVGFVRPTVDVTYTDSGKPVTVTKIGPRTFVISPIILGIAIGVVVLLLLVIVLLVIRRLRRRKTAVEPEAIEEPVAEEPAAEEPVAELPVIEEPVAEEPVAELPVIEEPVAEEPVVEAEAKKPDTSWPLNQPTKSKRSSGSRKIKKKRNK